MQMFQGVSPPYFNYSTFEFPVTGAQLIVFAVFSIFAILLCYDKWMRWRYEKLANKLKGPPNYPIIGSCLETVGDFYGKISHYGELYNYDGPLKFWFGSNFGVFITKPEDLQIILNSSKALDRGFLGKIIYTFTGDGLISAPVDKWKIQRRMLNPLFKYENIKETFFPVFHEKSKILIQNLQKEIGKTQPIDILDHVLNTALSSICQTLMEYNLDTQTDMGFKMAILKGTRMIFDRITKVWLYPDIIYKLYIRLFDEENIYTLANNLPRHIIEKKKNELYEQEFKKKNTIDSDINDGKKKYFKGLVETLMKPNDGGESFTGENIIGHVKTMVSAGSETSSLTVSYCLLMLAMYPDIQDKVYDEIYSVVGDNDDPITIEQTIKLVYLKQVIHETLRLFPTVPFIAKQLHDDVTISNHTLPKGTMCIITPSITHHNPELYPNPKSFNPDNFNADNVAKRHKYGFIPFSGGPRNCIGMKYGLFFTTVLITEVLRKFSLHTDMKFSDIKLKMYITLHNTAGFPITFQSRKNRNNVML